MQMTNQRFRTLWVLAVSILFVLSAAGKIAAATPKEDNPEVTRLLQQARDQAAELAKDADETESLIRTNASWESHANRLNEIKDHVNDLAKLVEKLNGSRDSASPWQQKAIDHIVPLLKELAANTTAAINHLNQNKTRPTTPDYAEYLKENAETAHELSDIISNFVQYGETRAKLNKLQQKIEIASR